MAPHSFDDFRVSFTPNSDGTFDVAALDARKHMSKGTFIPIPEQELATTCSFLRLDEGVELHRVSFAKKAVARA
jgi:hypothetical protein